MTRNKGKRYQASLSKTIRLKHNFSKPFCLRLGLQLGLGLGLVLFA